MKIKECVFSPFGWFLVCHLCFKGYLSGGSGMHIFGFEWVAIGNNKSPTCLLVLFFLILLQMPLLLTDTHSVSTRLILYPACGYESSLVQSQGKFWLHKMSHRY